MPVRVSWVSMGLAATAASVFLTSCSPSKIESARKESAALLAEAQKITLADAERYANKATDLEYPLYRSLMKAGRLDDALGGPQKAEQALHGLMGEFRRAAMGARADLPRLIKVGGLEEQHSYGMTGLGNSAFVSVLAGMLGKAGPDGSGTFESNSDGNSIKLTTGDSGVEVQVDYDGKFEDLQGKLSTTVAFDKCPDPQGRIHVKFVSKAAMSKPGSPGGANTSITSEGYFYYDDDANLTKNMDMDTHVEHAAFDGKGKGAFIDATFQSSTTDPQRNSFKVNRASSKVSEDDVNVVVQQRQLSELLAATIGLTGKASLDSGKCVTLKPTSVPGKRSGVKPNTGFEITAAPRSVLDGQPTGGTVTAKLFGGSSLSPENTKVAADAKFTYKAPGDKNQKATISFEARSKRGIGKATLDFDTNNRAYIADGGKGPWHGTSKICNLSEPFKITGPSAVNVFTPTSETGGTYSYTGNFGGIGVFGKGTYTIKVDENGGTLIASGPGSVKTPLGTYTATDSETYKLTPTEPCN